jgi:cyclopropane-fatty-acyl-phospholipid synthase
MSEATLEKTTREILASAGIEVDGNRPWDLHVHNRNFYRRVLAQGSLGLGESYMDGWWDAGAIDELICRMLKADLAGKVRSHWKLLWTYLGQSVLNRQDRAGARENVHRHYDLGNDLFTAMLGRHMLYSCANWTSAENLDEAEEARLALVCRGLDLKPGQKVLDIGCGWGALVKYAAEHYDVEAVGITLSEAQARLARRRCADLPVEIRIQDYRDVEGEFDRIVSLGMFEHVGHKNHRTFMEVVARCLPVDGVFMFHTIGSSRSVKTTDPWFNKYIFPNSQIPSERQVSGASEGLLEMESRRDFTGDYDRTLMAWHENFCKRRAQLEAKYGSRFCRMWKYYLLSSAGSFRARFNESWLMTFSKAGVRESCQAA